MDTVKNKNTIPEEKSLYILKGRFKSNSLNFYGLFLLIFNTHHELTDNHILVSTFSSAFDMEPHFGWEKYEEFIVNTKWKGNYNPNMTSSIENIFKRITTEKNGQKEIFFEYIKDYDYDNIEAFIFDVIGKIIHDKNLIIETGVQEASEIEFRETKKNRSQKKEAAQADKTASKGGVTLTIQLILAPVSGKPIYELKIGDIIMCKITPDTDTANYFIDLLDLRNDNTVSPVPAKVIDIKSEGQGYPLEILTEIGQGIYGKCIEEERQVKIKMYDPSVDKKIQSKNINKLVKEAGKDLFTTDETSFIDKINAPKSLYIMIGILAIIGLLIISFYILIF